MSIFYSHQGRLHDPAGDGRPRVVSSYPVSARRMRVIARWLAGWMAAAFEVMHQGIVTAKTRRLQRELKFHEIPQRPLILDDKWDF